MKIDKRNQQKTKQKQTNAKESDITSNEKNNKDKTIHIMKKTQRFKKVDISSLEVK